MDKESIYNHLPNKENYSLHFVPSSSPISCLIRDSREDEILALGEGEITNFLNLKVGKDLGKQIWFIQLLLPALQYELGVYDEFKKDLEKNLKNSS